MTKFHAEREYGPSRSKIKHGLIVGGVLVATGLWTLLLAGESLPDRVGTGLLAVAAGLAFALHAWWSGRTAGVQLRLGPEGVWFRQWGVTVPWSEIAEAGQSGTRLQPYVALILKDPEGFLGRLPTADGRALRVNRLWKPPELRIPKGTVEAGQEELVAALAEGLRAYRSPAP